MLRSRKFWKGWSQTFYFPLRNSAICDLARVGASVFKTTPSNPLDKTFGLTGDTHSDDMCSYMGL